MKLKQVKQNPTQAEALVLIRMKRDRAKAAMDHIVKEFGTIRNGPEPGLDVFLDYLTNMVYALELLLKVMSGDWETHHVGNMYTKVFSGRPHSSPILMTTLQNAICNQKFLWEPATGLVEHLPELETLWDELTTEFYRRSWMDDTIVEREVPVPPEFVQYLQANLPRFLRAETYHSKPRLSRDARIQMLQYQIEGLRRELAAAQSGEETPEESLPQVSARLQREHEERLKAATDCFDLNMRSRTGRLSFGTWRFGKVIPGCLG